MRVGVKTSTYQLTSAEPKEYAMSLWWMTYPSTWQTLVNHLHLQCSMQHPHLADPDAAASHTATLCSPAPIMKVLTDPVSNTAHLPVLIPAVQPPGKQMFHLQYTMTCVTMSHSPQIHS